MSRLLPRRRSKHLIDNTLFLPMYASGRDDGVGTIRYSTIGRLFPFANKKIEK